MKTLNIRNISDQKERLREVREYITQNFPTDNNLALATDSKPVELYETPEAKVVHILKPKLEPDRRIFMGCWNVAPNESNDQDGC
jgi:hypothetical protein